MTITFTHTIDGVPRLVWQRGFHASPWDKFYYDAMKATLLQTAEPA